MTIKKIFAFMLAFLLVAVSVVAVSAVAPPYSENFKSEEDMISALKKYEEQYPNYEKWTSFNSEIKYDEHLELRQIISIDLNNAELKPAEYSFMESSYGHGVDITSTIFYNEDKSDRVMSMVHYGYDDTEIAINLYNARKNKDVISYSEGTVNNRQYQICRFDADYTDYYLVEGQYLIHLRAFMKTDKKFLENVTIEYEDACIPVEIRDNTKWFEETLEKGYLIGDANSDGNLNIRDVTSIQKYLAKIHEVDKLVADFNGDFKIDIKDASNIQKKLAGLKYTCKRELYPVTYSYLGDIETKQIEAETRYAGPFADDEFALIMASDEGYGKNYANVFNTREEFEAFFGKTIDRYNEEFFKDNSLVYIYRSYSSSSFTWTPDIVLFEDGLLEVFCYYNTPDEDEVIENALSSNNLFYEVKKADIVGLKGVCVSELYEVILD